MNSALACLSRLDAAQCSNVLEVTKAVAEKLDVALDKVTDLVSQEAKAVCRRIDDMAAALKNQLDISAAKVMDHADGNTATINEKLDMLLVVHAQQRAEQVQRETVQQAIVASSDTFNHLFVPDPCSLEEWSKGRGQYAQDSTELDRSELGTGTLATTYRVRTRPGVWLPGVQDEQLFAVKIVLKAKLAKLYFSKDTVEKEVKSLQRMKHVSIINLHRVFEDVDFLGRPGFFLLMELAEGGTLAKMIDAALSLPDVWKWTLQLVKVLAYIHDQGLAHCDLKPENIFLSKSRNIKVGDFGLATDVAGSILAARDMEAVGTKIYFSPELGIKGLKGSVRANDIWALGCILVEMAQRKRLESELYPPEMASERRRLIKIARDEDPALGAIGSHMLVEDYGRRFSADQLLRLFDPLPPSAPPQVVCTPRSLHTLNLFLCSLFVLPRLKPQSSNLKYHTTLMRNPEFPANIFAPPHEEPLDIIIGRSW